jgi:hypothetical protein
MTDLLGGPPERLRAVADRAQELWRERFTLRRYQEQVVEVLERAARNGT